MTGRWWPFWVAVRTVLACLLGGWSLISCVPEISVASPEIASVSIGAATGNLLVGGEAQLTATVRDSRGLTLGAQPVTWMSSNAAVVSVDASGRVRGQGSGTSTVSASAGGKSADVVITVIEPVMTVTLNSSNVTLGVGGSQQLTATLRDRNGAVLSGRTIDWSSSNSAVATVSSTGLVTAVAYTGGATRTASITATSEGKVATATITVTPAPVASVSISPTSPSVAVGATLQLTATVRDAAGNILTDRTITWSSGYAAWATVSSSGLVTPAGYGGTDVRGVTITATSEGKMGSTGVTITPAPVASMTVTPVTAILNVGATRQLTATTLDASGATLTGRTVTWTTSNASVATVSSTGFVSAVAVGSATITATSEGRSGTAVITVQVPSVASVEVQPASATLAVGVNFTLEALTRDASGALLVGRTVTWLSSNTAVATVATSGTVTAVAAGTATITATSEGKTGTATITVPGSTSTSCSTANPPSAGQSLCVSFSYSLPSASTGTTREYLLSRSSTTGVLVTLSGGTGDADMDIFHPSGALFCSTSSVGNNDSCAVSGGVGTWRIRVYAYTSYSGVTLRIQ